METNGFKAIKIIELNIGQIFWRRIGSITKLKIIAQSKKGKSVTYIAENGLDSRMKANTIVWIKE